MKGLSFLLVALASTSLFAGISGAPVVVSQTQLYAQHDPRLGYLNRYVDFPLFLDNDRFPIQNVEQIGHRRISQSDLDFQREIVKEYGIDGFAFFTSWTRMENVFKANEKSAVKGTLMLPIIGFWHHPENDEAAFPEALDNSCGYKIGGKQLILSYWTAKFHTPEQLKAKLSSLRAKYGDRFLLAADLPQAARSSYQDAFRREGRLTAEQTKEYQDYVRSYLRASDGVYIGETHMMKKPEAGEFVFNTEYYRHVLRLTREVLSEKEFCGKKLLGTSAVVGHENHYARGHNVSHDCTRTLRRSLEAAIEYNPDFIMLPEWDEWNENTCFAPTVCNSFSTQRIVRYYMAKLGKIPLAKSGDDLSIPNLIVSYRRLLSPGERLTIEVLGLPDGCAKGRLNVWVELRNENGDMVRAFSEQAFDQEQLSEMRFVAASEDLASAGRALSVVLHCRDAEGRELVVDEGLSPIDLCCGNAWLHKSVKQPLRDMAILRDKSVAYSNGWVTAQLRCDRPIRYAMVVANGNVVKVVGKPGVEERFREDEETVAFAISDVAIRSKTDAKAGFKFTVRGGKDVEWLRLADQYVKGDTLKTEWISAAAEPIYLRLKKSSLNTAELEIDFPGFAHKTVSLANVFECGTYAIGEGIATFGIRRFVGQARFPSPLNATDCSFRVPVRGNRQSNVYSVDVVTMDGKIWRSRGFVDEPTHNEPVCTRVWSAVNNEAKDIILPRARVPLLEYDLSNRCGDVIMPRTSESRFLGIFGGFVGAVSGYNRGHSTMNCLDGFSKWFATASDPRPSRESDGVLVFDGKDDIVGFSYETLPYSSSWTVEMEVMPKFTDRSEVLLSCRTKGTGNLNGIFVHNGLVRVEYVGLNVCSDGGYSNIKFSQRLSADKWNSIRLRYLVDAIELTINGVTERMPCVAPGQLPAPLQLGGVTAEVPGGNFFTGKIRNFRIDYSSPNNATKRLQSEIDRVAASGGGVVNVPDGLYKIGGLELRSNVELHLEKGARLEGLYGLENYRVLKLPYSEGDWSAIIMGVNVTNVAVTGEGVIDGQGPGWPPTPKGFKGCHEGLRPRGLFFAYSKNIRLEGYTLLNTACWGQVFKNCDGVTARNITVFNHGNMNNDGFDIEAKNVLIENCVLDTNDDQFCIKSNDPDFTVENVTIRNCVARGQASAFKIGTATRGVVRHVRVYNLRCEPTQGIFNRYADGTPCNFLYHLTVYQRPENYPYGFGLIGIAVECVDGGCVEDVVVDGVEFVDGFKIPIFVRADNRSHHHEDDGFRRGRHNVLRDVTIRNVKGYAMGPVASSITGVRNFRVKDVRLENIDIVQPGAGEVASKLAMAEPLPYQENQYPSPDIFYPSILPAYGLYIDHADDVTLSNVVFRVLKEGPVDMRPAIVRTGL